MAGIFNRTARQYNLKGCSKKGHRVTIRVAPGFNVVDDEHWEAFVDKEKGEILSPFVKELHEKGDLRFGEREDNMELEQDADTVSKSKSVPIAQMEADLEKSSEELETIKNELIESKGKADKAEAEAREAVARAEKAELELVALKEAKAEVKTKADETPIKKKN